MKYKKNYLNFLIPKIWQILKRFSGAFRHAQTLKLRGVSAVCLQSISNCPVVFRSGLLKEAFTDADIFGINFPMDLDVRMKAVCLAACFLIGKNLQFISILKF